MNIDLKDLDPDYISILEKTALILYSKDEIIIKCSLEEMKKAFFKDYEIIWHDPNVNSQENQQYLTQLEKLCKVKTFIDWKEVDDYIKAAKTICHLITSGTNGELLVNEIFSNQNVPKIFTFCRNEEYHSAWAKDYEKVLCTETKIEDVISQIQTNLLEWQKQTSSLKFDLPAFAPIFDDWDKSQMNHLHHYLKVIPRFRNRAQAKEDVITLSREVYSSPKDEKFIADFEKNYNDYKMEDILRWYTQPSFLYKMINNCLRIATSDSIQWSRFLLKDIETAIKDQYQTKSKNFSGLLYRAAYLSEKEWSNLKGNINRDIEMHGFLSVSKDKDAALKFMGVDPAQKVFITIIIPKGPIVGEQGFAEVEEFSKFPNEKEVLFNVRSRFTVLEAEDKFSKDIPHRHLVLLYGAQGLRKYITEKNPVQQISIEDIAKISCFHCKISVSKIAEKFIFLSLITPEKRIYSCKNCLNSNVAPFLCVPLVEKKLKTEIKGCLSMDSNQAKIPFYGYKCLQCGVKKEERYFLCTDCDEIEKRWCQLCFENPLDCIELKHSIILENYPFSFWCKEMSEQELNHLKYQNDLVKEKEQVFQQAHMYIQTHEYEKAIEYYNLSLEQIASFNNSYQSEDDGTLESQFHALVPREIIHLNVATSYSEIGSVYHLQEEYTKALEYYFKSLHIYKSIHGENHPVVASSYNSIGAVFRGQGEYKKAIEYYLESLNIYKSTHGENDLVIAISYNNLGLAYYKQGEYKKALEYHFKSLDILKSFHGENHSSVAISYNNIGLASQEHGEYSKALEYHFQALDIRKSIHGENHPEVALSYDNIGVAYNEQGEHSKALGYFLKSLEIRKSIHGGSYHGVATSYGHIGSLYHHQKEYNQALEYYLKSLHIFESIQRENHPDVATAYYNIGSIYQDKGEYNKTVEYFLKSLDISKSFYGENHPIIATSYIDIGLVYNKKGEFSKGLEYFLKSLDICRLIYEENHPVIANSLNNIALLYKYQGDYNKALEYHLKSLDIFRSIYEENHPYIATIYTNIGSDYHCQRKYNQAVEYYLKSLHISKSVHGKDHPHTIALCNLICEIVSMAQNATQTS